MMVVIVGLFAGYTFSQKSDRVERARQNKQALVEKLFADAGVLYPPDAIFIRVFKWEAELELWARGSDQAKFSLIQVYPVCYVPGQLGPKRREGDKQVPEGAYEINFFNPRSSYHLSLGLNYPNRSDRLLADPDHPGGEIFIHGKCVSIGCVPIRNGPIEEVYLACLDSWERSRRAPLVHIFPCRMNDQVCERELERRAASSPDLRLFWENLAEVFLYFEQEGSPPEFSVDDQGRYVIKRP